MPEYRTQGLALNSSSGQLYGTITTPGPYSFRVQLTDSRGLTAQSAPISGTVVADPTFTCSSSGTLEVGLSYIETCTETGGTPPFSWYAPVLPTGLVFTASGGITSAISGTPLAASQGAYQVNLEDSATTANGGGGQHFYHVVLPLNIVAAPSFSCSSPGTPQPSVYYSQICTATGGTAPYGWSITTGSLPAGLSLTTNGGTATISGTPSAPGAYSYTIKLTDSAAPTPQSYSAMQSLSVGGVGPTFSCTNYNGPSELGVMYSTTCTASGGGPPYSWSIIEVLPAGLSLSATTGGSTTISGTPSEAGAVEFALKLADSAGNSSSLLFMSTIAPVLAISCTVNTPPNAVGTPYSTTCSASGGMQPYTWSISGGSLPTGLSLGPTSGASTTISGMPAVSSAGSVNYTLTLTDSSATPQSATQKFSGLITAPLNPLRFTSAPQQMTFSIDPNGVASPAQVLPVFSVGPATTFTATANVAWLNVGGGGTTPANLTVSLVPGNLQANTTSSLESFQGSITITNGTITSSVPVTVQVRPLTTGAELLAMPSALNFNLTARSSAAVQQVMVTDSGGGSLSFTAQASTASCGRQWLSLIGPTTGIATAETPAMVTVQADPTQIPNAAGNTCEGQISISTGTVTQTISVSMAVSVSAKSMLLSQTGLTFVATEGAGVAPPAQSFTVLNTGNGSLGWSAAAQGSTGGAAPGWLGPVSPNSGSSTSASASPAEISLNPAALQNLAPGQYFATVLVSSPDARNSPQAATISLIVLPSGQTPAPAIAPAGLLFVGSQGNAPAAQTVNISNAGPTSITYSAIAQTDDGASWLSVTPSGVVPASGSTALAVKTSIQGLTPDVYHGTIRVGFGDANGTTESIDVLLNLQSTGGSACGSYTASFVSPGPNFSYSVNQSVPVQVAVVGCSGSAITSGATVMVSAMTSTSPNATTNNLALAYNPSTGYWETTWTAPPLPGHTVMTLAAGTGASYVAPANSVNNSQNGDIVSTNGLSLPVISGLVNGASSDPAMLNRITPGAWIVIYGLNGIAGTSLGSSTATAVPPYPFDLGGVQVQMQGLWLPLYFVNSNQVNALIPEAVNVNEVQQLVVTRDDGAQTTLPIQVAPVEPGIFTTNQYGTGQGAILLNATGQIAAAAGAFPGSAPAPVNTAIQIYCTGLGPVLNPPPDGTIPPTVNSVLAPAGTAVNVIFTDTTNGNSVTATSLYAGLNPYLVGVYQVDVVIPPNAPTGPAVQVQVEVAGVTSRSGVTLAIGGTD